MTERARAASQAGLDSLFVGDHHVTGGPYYQNVAILGRLLAEWSDGDAPRPFGALFLLPLWHPVLLAEQIGTLASLAGGRFIMQCAIGAGRAQFAAMGADPKKRPSQFESTLATVRDLLGGGQVDGAGIAPRPAEPVDVWIGASAPAAIDRAARLGDGWLCGPNPPPDEAAAQLRVYLERCDANGRRPGLAAIRRDVHVGGSIEDAHRVADPVLERGYRGFQPGAVIVGDAQGVAEELAGLAELGFTDVLIRHLADDHDEVLGSFERLAEVRSLIANR
jgi:alkanesulfonate monooxygenase SsuD/methylene tetrahydromethanopterin reductase-like flavin-dependent oxidoreductase (luciferase family)